MMTHAIRPGCWAKRALTESMSLYLNLTVIFRMSAGMPAAIGVLPMNQSSTE